MNTQRMNIGIIGGGGREHALASILKPRAKRVWLAPGNGGTTLAERYPIPSISLQTLLPIVREEHPDLLIIGPEKPLAEGIVNALKLAGVKVFGPTKGAARIEASKVWMKKLCTSAGIPTASYQVADRYAAAEEIVEAWGAPIVVKADGLCGGKGVKVCATAAEAKAFARALLEEKIFGDAGQRVVIERALTGRECSVFALCDGVHAELLIPARDYKRLRNSAGSPNTGGMGAYAPLPDVDATLMADIKGRIFMPALRGMQKLGCPFHGILYAGLMLTDNGPQVLEFNARFGDPEAQVVLPLLNSDLVPHLVAAMEPGGLAGLSPPEFKERAAVCVVLAAAGYPVAPVLGAPIYGIEEARRSAFLFHAGTKETENGFVVAGGRVLDVVGVGDTLAEARARAYAAVARIWFAGMQYRPDIAEGL